MNLTSISKKIIFLMMGLFLLCPPPSFAWETYDKIIALVNSIPILESEVNNKLHQLNQLSKKSNQNIKYTKQMILDIFIENALIYEVAKEKSIIINDSKVFLHIEKIMHDFFSKQKDYNPKIIPRLIDQLEKRLTTDAKKNQGKDLNKFIEYIENEHLISIEDFFEEIKTQLRKEQVMAIAIGVSPPSEKKALAWYKKNITNLGYEVKFRQIVIKPQSDSITSQKKTNDLMLSLRKKIISGQSFEKIEKKFSEAYNPNEPEWIPLAELNPYLANALFLLKKKGKISSVIKTNFGYHLLKLIDKQPTSFGKIKNMIIHKLYQEELQKQFKKWINRQKKKAEIKIFN